MLINLVGNSVKFTDIGGEIVVVCSIGCTTCYLRRIFGTSENSPYQHGGGDHECFAEVKTGQSTPSPKQITSSISGSSKSTSSSSAVTSNSDDGVGVRIEKADKAEDRRSSTRLLAYAKAERDREREEKEKRRSASAKAISEVESPKKKKKRSNKASGSADSSKTHSRNASGSEGTEMKSILEDETVQTAPSRERLPKTHSRAHSGSEATSETPTFARPRYYHMEMKI